MQTKNIRRIVLALFALTVFLGTRQGAFAQAFGPGTIATNDNTLTLGQFTVIVNPAFQTRMMGYPGYNSTTHVLTSPVLFDPNTIVGRSAPLQVGSVGDISGVPVGNAGIIISNAMMTVQPGGLEPVGTREVHTMVYSMNMRDIFGGTAAAVRAGTNATLQPISSVSPGEVESLSGALGAVTNDFPAQSFFDVFVDVDIPSGGTNAVHFPGATNMFNSLPLMVQNTNLTSFPPQVVYIHGMSTAVPIKFSSDNPGVWTNGQIFGLLTLAGHGVFQTNSATGQNQTVAQATTALQTTLAATTPSPVEPQYASWSPGATVAGTNMIFPSIGDDNTTSLGTFELAVNPAFQPFMSGYPGWNPVTKRLTSPLLYDPATKIGRSSVTLEGSASDTNGVPVGTAGTLVRDAGFTIVPPLFESASNTMEVHTEVRSLNMTGGGAAVRAGTAGTGLPGSYGEVESLSGASADPFWDFPARSFFDIFVDVDLPAGGAIPSAFTVTNTQPLVVQNNNLTTFPPNVVYVHGNSTAVPVAFTAAVPAIGAHAGDIFGILLLAGHGINFKEGTASQQQFQAAVAQMTEMPVAPQYATWATGLNVPLQIGKIIMQAGGIPQISGYCTPSTTLTLQSTTDLGAIGGPVWVDEVTTTGTTNSTFIVAPTSRPTASVKFYRMVDNTR